MIVILFLVTKWRITFFPEMSDMKLVNENLMETPEAEKLVDCKQVRLDPHFLKNILFTNEIGFGIIEITNTIFFIL